jgi:hypothetical protein
MAWICPFCNKAAGQSHACKEGFEQTEIHTITSLRQQLTEAHELNIKMNGEVLDWQIKAEKAEAESKTAYLRGLEDCLLESIKREVAGTCMRGGVVAEAISKPSRRWSKWISKS